MENNSRETRVHTPTSFPKNRGNSRSSSGNEEWIASQYTVSGSKIYYRKVFPNIWEGFPSIPPVPNLGTSWETNRHISEKKFDLHVRSERSDEVKMCAAVRWWLCCLFTNLKLFFYLEIFVYFSHVKVKPSPDLSNDTQKWVCPWKYVNTRIS